MEERLARNNLRFKSRSETCNEFLEDTIDFSSSMTSYTMPTEICQDRTPSPPSKEGSNGPWNPIENLLLQLLEVLRDGTNLKYGGIHEFLNIGLPCTGLCTLSWGEPLVQIAHGAGLDKMPNDEMR